MCREVKIYINATLILLARQGKEREKKNEKKNVRLKYFDV